MFPPLYIESESEMQMDLAPDSIVWLRAIFLNTVINSFTLKLVFTFNTC